MIIKDVHAFQIQRNYFRPLLNGIDAVRKKNLKIKSLSSRTVISLTSISPSIVLFIVYCLIIKNK